MSKRSGEFITLDELLAEIGPTRPAGFSRHARPTTGIDFDIELAKKQSNENPVYYVQYAHARCASILRNAAEPGSVPTDPGRGAPPPSGRAGAHPPPDAPARGGGRCRRRAVRRTSCRASATRWPASSASSTATAACCPRPDERRYRARLALVDATRQVLANALGPAGDLRARRRCSGSASRRRPQRTSVERAPSTRRGARAPRCRASGRAAPGTASRAATACRRRGELVASAPACPRRSARPWRSRRRSRPPRCRRSPPQPVRASVGIDACATPRDSSQIASIASPMRASTRRPSSRCPASPRRPVGTDRTGFSPPRTSLDGAPARSTPAVSGRRRRPHPSHRTREELPTTSRRRRCRGTRAAPPSSPGCRHVRAPGVWPIEPSSAGARLPANAHSTIDSEASPSTSASRARVAVVLADGVGLQRAGSKAASCRACVYSWA